MQTYQDIQLGHKHRFVLYKRSFGDVSIVVDKTAPPSATFNDFVASLPANECRYAIFDFEYELSAADGLRQKILFVVWAPDTAKIKDKMLTASSKDALKKKLVGISVEVQATDLSEITKESVVAKITAISR